MEKEKAIKFWYDGSRRNLKTARDLIKIKHYDWALFLYHLAIEKLLKACVINANITPPHIHKLEYLSSLAKLSVSDEQLLWLREITTFSIETRYPKQKFDFYKKATLVYTKLWSGRCEEIYQWLKKQLLYSKK